jgi:UDP-N-acetylglucosamine transferase subunit ALG13
MIFVTVGTTMPFDELLEETDRLAERHLFGEDVLCQYGQSAYRMQHASDFRAKAGLDDLFSQSSLVITHGGSTVIKLLLMQKPFIAFPNPRSAGDHQTAFLKTVANVADISWSSNVHDLADLFRERRNLGPAKVRGNIVRASELIRNFL